jgi:hypothetical protein
MERFGVHVVLEICESISESARRRWIEKRSEVREQRADTNAETSVPGSSFPDFDFRFFR